MSIFISTISDPYRMTLFSTAPLLAMPLMIFPRILICLIAYSYPVSNPPYILPLHREMVFSELGLHSLVYSREPTTKNYLEGVKKKSKGSVGEKILSIRTCEMRYTFPVLVFFTSNATSVVASGVFFTSQIRVSSPSPGMTGAVKRTPKYRNAEGTPPPTALRTARAANPNVDKPCRIAPPKPASEPTRGSAFRSEIFCVSRRGEGAHRCEVDCNRPRDGRSEPVLATFGPL